jgi:hypothetical protein
MSATPTDPLYARLRRARVALKRVERELQDREARRVAFEERIDLARPKERPAPKDLPAMQDAADPLRLLGVIHPAAYRAVLQIIKWRLIEDWNALPIDERRRAVEQFDARFPKPRGAGERLV